MNLCCALNPCYVCEACGFQECLDHWNTKKWKTGWENFHFAPPYEVEEATCTLTSKRLKIVESGEVTMYKLI